MAIEVIGLTIATTTFGSLFLCFEQSLRWHIRPALNFALPIAVAITCQLFIGVVLLNDVKKRVWSDEIKCDLWASLGRSQYVPYNCSLYTSPLLSFAYFAMIMMGDPNVHWWREKRRASLLCRTVSHAAVMNVLSKITASAPFAFIGGLLLFALGGVLNSDRLFLLGFQVFGGTIIVLPPIAGIFHFVVLTHFLSRTWVDHSYELFYDEYPVGRWPKHDWLNVRRYYSSIMRNEANDI